MAYTPLPKVNCAYGAPMGRGEAQGDASAPIRFYLRRVPLDSGGYDRGGAYWGIGLPLYEYQAQGCTAYGFTRARTREAAKADVLATYPLATFYR